ncbi:MAG: hypothetical protein JKY50_21870 [Oleispira sp.]|nr:hypothetical protein [Oleispira sp.]MBL4880453.1 hypothetical protein [Oleispira sp.]
MMNIISRVSRYLLFLVVFLSLNVVGAQEAGLSFRGEGLGSLDSGPGDKFGSNQIALTLPLEHKSRKNESFTSYFNFDITKFDWRGTTAAQNDYIWLSMPIEYSQQRGRSNQFLLTVEPGLMTDGNNVGFDSIGINGSVIGRRFMRNGGYWQYGVIVDRAFGDYDVRPVLGMAFQATSNTWMEIGFPEVNIKHHFSKGLQSFFVIKPAGGVWKEEVDITTSKEDETLQYNNWQIGLGADFHWRKKLWLNAEIGQLRKRRIRATDETGARLKGTPGHDRYWQVGAKLKF